MSNFITKTRKLSSERPRAYGVVDGVAGAWVNPQYIRPIRIDFEPGTRQYYESVATQMRRSVETYRQELKEANV